MKMNGIETALAGPAESGGVSSEIGERLRALADPGDEFREFTRRITVTHYPVVGVRTPALRRLARQISRGSEADVAEYLREGPGHSPSYEDVMLYGQVLAARSTQMPTEEFFTRLERLVPYFDSWAHVDMIIGEMKLFRKYREESLRRFSPLKTHSGEFEKRSFVILLMAHFLDAEHVESVLEELQGVPQGQYYVDMALAWTLAEALVKHYESAEPLLHGRIFSRFVHNKAIQKARESRRVAPERKEYLKSLKI